MPNRKDLFSKNDANGVYQKKRVIQGDYRRAALGRERTGVITAGKMVWSDEY
jgi:hypothetical protein